MRHSSALVIAVDPNDTKAAMLSVLLLDFGR
jgi:hypothetical protein